MKKFKKCIAWFLTIVFMIPTVLSCTQENDLAKSNIDIRYTEMAKTIISSQELFYKYYNDAPGSRMFENGEITQEDVDYYASLMGHQEGSISVDLIEAIIDKYGDVLDRGYEEVLEDYNLTDFTKLSMVDIAEGRWIEDLESHPNYENLNLTEKEMLSLANAFSKELEQRGFSPDEGIGAFFGMLIGGFICNILCVLGGAIIGALIGNNISKNQ